MTAGNQPPHGDADAAPSRWRRWTPRVLALLLALLFYGSRWFYASPGAATA